MQNSSSSKNPKKKKRRKFPQNPCFLNKSITFAAVTTTKNDIDNVVTEYGIARLKGKTAGQRAKALIDIAHPKFREELLFEARKMNLMV